MNVACVNFELMEQFIKHNITVPYKRETWTFKVHARSIWQWVLDLLNNPHISPHFVWDAERLYKHDSAEFEHFYDEPWTADSWWDIQVGYIVTLSIISCSLTCVFTMQSELPASTENAVPLALILYADKSKLSSFGTVKGYPVVVRCGNLPVDIWNM